MAQILKLSEEGYDAKTADGKNLIIDNSLECLKINEFGEGSITAITDTDIGGGLWEGVEYIDIEHELNFVPIFRIFGNTEDWTWDVLAELPCEDQGGDSLGYVTAYIDSTKLRIYYFYYVGGEGISKTFNFKYYIFGNKLE